jgi:hypothetical protein
VPPCPPGRLDDVADVVAAVRTWPGVVEKKPLVFYVAGEPFLHFHLLDGGRRRRADVKARTGWIQIELREPVSPTARRALQRAIRLRYRERLGR